jgi:hypothetical protein
MDVQVRDVWLLSVGAYWNRGENRTAREGSARSTYALLAAPVCGEVACTMTARGILDFDDTVSATLSYLDYRYMSETQVPWRLCLAGQRRREGLGRGARREQRGKMMMRRMRRRKKRRM